MNKQNQAFCKAFTAVHGNVIHSIDQLEKTTFEGDHIPDVLIPMCEIYHKERMDQESYLIAGEKQFNDLELTFYKWTNPFFWIWAILYGLWVLAKSLFVTAKDFKR